jgi:hypothetical protein
VTCRLTEHVAWTRLQPKDFLVLERVAEPQQQTCASLEAVDGVAVRDLQAARHHADIEPLQAGAVDLAGLPRVAAEAARLEHLETGNGEALATAVDLARLLALVTPLGAGAGVEQHRHQEQVEQAARAFLVVDRGRPRRHQLVDARAAANIKVLPAAVGRNARIVGRIVSLLGGQLRPARAGSPRGVQCLP